MEATQEEMQMEQEQWRLDCYYEEQDRLAEYEGDLE